MKIIVTILSVLVVLTAVGWLGLQIKPRSFAAFSAQSGTLPTVPLPDDLPAPVARYFRQLYGDEVPVILLPDKKGQVGNQYPANDQATRSRLSQAH